MEHFEKKLKDLKEQNFKHISIQVEDKKLISGLVYCIKKEYGVNNDELLLVNLEKQGEGNRPSGESGLGTITKEDVKNSLITVTLACNIEDQISAFNRFIFLSCNIVGFFITDRELQQKDSFNNNPVYQSICPCVNMVLDEKGFVKEIEYITDYKNDDFDDVDNEKINLR